jgi:hypothetical protein
MRNKLPKFVILLLSILIPGMGHLLLGRQVRGLIFIFWIIIFTYITFQLSTPDISALGRLSGGIAVWLLSVLEVYKILRKSKQAY